MATIEDQTAEARAEEETTLTPEPTPEVEERTVEPQLEVRRKQAETMRGSREAREFSITGMECRALDDGTIRMSGYASLTESPYEIGYGDRGFTETIKRGAFKRTLSESPDTVLLVNHDGLPLAGTRNGSLALAEDAKGLKWTADLDADDPDSRQITRKVEQGLIDQCSFAFVCTDDVWNDDFSERQIKSLSIHRGDVSVVTHAANPATSVGVSARSFENALVEVRAGKALSTATMDTLTRVLGLVSDADDAVDKAQPLLADLMGVENPDADDEGAEPDEADSARSAEEPETPEEPEPEVKTVYVPDHTTRARERLATLRRQA